uniref:Uncharacterized protein n=1 Tax=Plectus sambesii TaxID=2011161 RepID=A0A914UUT4_9BILA
MNWGERMRCQSLAVVVGVRRIGRWAICTRHACKVGREKRRWRLCAGRPKSDAPMVATELFASEPVDHWSDPTPLSSLSLSLSLSQPFVAAPCADVVNKFSDRSASGSPAQVVGLFATTTTTVGHTQTAPYADGWSQLRGQWGVIWLP